MVEENSIEDYSKNDGIQTISAEQFLAHTIPEFIPFLQAVEEVPIQIPTAKGKSTREVTLGEWLEKIKSSNQNGPIKLSPDDISSIACQMRQAFPEDSNHTFPGVLELFPYFGIDDLRLDTALKRRLSLLQQPLRGLYGLVADYRSLDPRVLGDMGENFNPAIYKVRRVIRNNDAKLVNYFLTLNSDYEVPPDIIVDMYKTLMHKTGLTTLSLLMDGVTMQDKGVQSILSRKPGQLEGLIRGVTAEVNGVSALMKLGFNVLPVEYDADRHGLDYLACDRPINVGDRLLTPLHAVQIKGRPNIQSPVVISEAEMRDILNSRAVKFGDVDIRSADMMDMHALLHRTGNEMHIVKRKRKSKQYKGREFTDAGAIWVYAPTLMQL